MAFVVLLWVAACTVAITRLTHGAEKWDPALAAKYLDDRQEAWASFKPAQSPDGPCISCHTGMPYLLARPALRRVLHESAPTQYETTLIARLDAKAGSKPAGNLQSVETIFAAMFATDVLTYEPQRH